MVVVAYRSADTIEDCLRSVLSDPRVTRVSVRDNSSDSRTEQLVTSITDPRLEYHADRNVGFARGCNAGARDVLGEGADAVDWLAFVNPDVILERTLTELIALVGDRPATLIGAEVSSAPGILSARPAAGLGRELAKAALGPRVYAMATGSLGPDPAYVGQVCGALQVIRATDFLRLGGFDERFELYYEDVDLSDRANADRGAVFVPQRWGSHLGGASGGSSSPLVHRVGRISRIRYLRKNHPGRLTEAALPIIAGVDFLARSVTRQPEGSRARREALSDQWRELRHPGSVTVLR